MKGNENVQRRSLNVAVRLLKICVAIVLLSFATLAAAREVSLIAQRATLTWHQHLGSILIIGLCVCAAYLLIRRSKDSLAQIHCPRCMTMGGHTLAPRYRRSVNPLAWHFGGFLLSIFYSGSKQHRFRCRECNEFFCAHTSVSRGYRLLLVLFVALIVNHIWADLSEMLGQ